MAALGVLLRYLIDSCISTHKKKEVQKRRRPLTNPDMQKKIWEAKDDKARFKIMRDSICGRYAQRNMRKLSLELRKSLNSVLVTWLENLSDAVFVGNVIMMMVALSSKIQDGKFQLQLAEITYIKIKMLREQAGLQCERNGRLDRQTRRSMFITLNREMEKVLARILRALRYL